MDIKRGVCSKCHTDLDMYGEVALKMVQLSELGIEGYQGILGLLADRDEWKQQHENLLSVRQSDLAVVEKYRNALFEINELRGTTLNFGVARFIACTALGIKHTDSKEPPSERQQLAKPAVEWIRSKDRQPNDLQEVLIWKGNWKMETRIYYDSDWYTMDGFSTMNIDSKPEKVTHWQPLPNPPAAYDALQDK
jgi:hypothetical protein